MSRNSVRPLINEEDTQSSDSALAYCGVIQRPSTVTMEMVPAQNGVATDAKKDKYKENGHQNSSCNSMRTEQTIISSQNGGSSEKIIADDKCSEAGVGNLDLYKAMMPLIKCMEIFGLWHSDIISPERRERRRSFCRKVFNTYNYSILVLVLLWFNLLRWIPSFFVGSNTDSSRLYFKVIYLAFLLQCALNHSVIFWTTSKPERVPAFFRHWEKIQNNPITAVPFEWVNKRAKIFTAIGLVYIFLAFLNQASSVFSPIESMFNSSQIFVAPFEPHPAMHIVILALNIFDFANWIFSIFIFMIFAMTLRYQFERVHERINESITDAANRGVFPEDFEILRRQHTDLCIAVDKANHGLFTYMNVIIYLTMVPLACFLFYNLLFSGIDGDNVSAYVMYSTWVLSIFINVGVVSWIAALMSTSCHEPLDKIYECVLKDISNEQQLQVNMFLSRLNGEPVGFTIYDLVTLTKPFILTIAGLAITYYALIAEFN